MKCGFCNSQGGVATGTYTYSGVTMVILTCPRCQAILGAVNKPS